MQRQPSALKISCTAKAKYKDISTYLGYDVVCLSYNSTLYLMCDVIDRHDMYIHVISLYTVSYTHLTLPTICSV